MAARNTQTRTPTIEEALFGDVRVKKRQVAKLKVEGDLQASSLFISTEFDERDLNVTLTDCETAWTGSLSHSQLAELAKKASKEQSQYQKLTLNALNGIDENSMICSTTLQGSNVKLSWKELLTDGIRFELGSMTLYCQDEHVKEIHSGLLEHLVQRVNGLQSDFSQLTEVHTQLDRQHKSALEKLEQNIQLKETIEKDLFGKFLLVLNSKKAKIRHLLENKPTQDSIDKEDTNSPEAISMSEEREESPPSPKRTAIAPEPVKRRKRVSANRSHTIPSPPVIEERRRSRAPSEGESIESDKLLELL